MKIRRLASIGLAAALGAAGVTFAVGTVSQGVRPLAEIDRTTTAMIAPDVPARKTAEAETTDTLPQLMNGLAALNARRIDAALAMRDALPVNSLDRHILSWAVAQYGGEAVPSTEIEQTRRDLADWPGAENLRRNLERSLFAETQASEDVLRDFENRPPLTPAGAIVLARARLASGDRNGARGALSNVWRTQKIEMRDEMVILREFADILTTEDHRIRMEHMLYEEDTRAASRVAERAGASALNAAWSAVLGNSPNAQSLMGAVPGDQRSPGYSFLRIKILRKANKLSEAAGLMLKAPSSADALIDPEAWWTERRLLARSLFDAGKVKLAYQIVSEHAAQTPLDLADAEFMAGWYALRGLNDPIIAERHFGRITLLAESPITRARAYYWLGRAADAAGSADAARHYQAAAKFGTTYYGQLAAARVGSPALNLPSPQPTSEDRARFGSREAVRAIDRLEAAAQSKYAYRLYLDLARQITSPGEIALLCERAAQNGNHFVALKIAKTAAQRGIEVGALSHPVGVIPDDADMAGAGMALAYAVARQESEFNTGAVSSAGALGLLQLMPNTAQDIARTSGLAYSQEKLTADPVYNATLGAAMLDQQLQRFDGSYVLTFVAYNAGPRRVDQWIARYGDPRDKTLDDVIDWIERIPFSETRGYVQRVMENYEVYKMRLSGHFDIVSDLTKGRITPNVAN